MGKRTLTAVKLLFIAYSLWMLWLLFGQRVGDWSGGSYGAFMEQNLNLVPFATIRRFTYVLQNSTDPVLLKQAVVNLAGNVCMFVPLGFFLPCVFRKMGRFWRMLLCSAGLILAMEGLQFLTFLGCCDIDDVILNMLGILLGFLLWKLTCLLLAKQ